MQVLLIVKDQMDPIENENAPKEYKPNEWTKLDRIACASIWMKPVQITLLYVAILSDKI